MAEKGQDYIVELTSDGGTTYEKIGFLRSKTLSRSKETIDTSSDEDPDWASSIPGMRSFNVENGGLYVYDDLGQQAVEAAYDSDDPVGLRLTNNVAGAKQYAGDAHITQLDLEFATNEVVKYSVSWQGTGPVTASDVAA